MISIIIPAYNESGSIAATIQKTHAANGDHPIEIIVVDGGSNDGTADIAGQQPETIVTTSSKGRAIQMNKGASIARGDILYFLHADTVPPQEFTTHIMKAVENGSVAGSFRLSFDVDHWFLRLHCWFTRFNINSLRFGDQSLFVKRDVFVKCNGFREDLHIMEDQEIIGRLRRHGKFDVLKKAVTTSARKYMANGVFRLQGVFYYLWFLYYLGASQSRLHGLYQQLIRDQIPVSDETR